MQTKNEIYIGILVLVVISIGGVFLLSQKNIDAHLDEPRIPKAINSSDERTKKNFELRKTANSDEPPLKLKGIGVVLDAYDPTTNRAGDFVFTKAKLQFDRLFMGYGFFIPMTNVGSGKKNPQPTYIVPLKTHVRSLVDGVVANVPTLWSGDVSIQVTQDGKMEKWIYEVEHVINPTVKIGDQVRAGQIIGEVSDFDKRVPAGFGVVEIGILKGGNPPSHVCPFAYLDETIREETFSNLKSLMNAWEEYRRDFKLYDETVEKIPGCLLFEPIEG